MDFVDDDGSAAALPELLGAPPQPESCEESMPADFYAKVEALLLRPAPSLPTASSSSLPSLSNKKAKPPVVKRRRRKPGPLEPRPLDPQKVEEAMRYAASTRRQVDAAPRRQERTKARIDAEERQATKARIDAEEMAKLVDHFQSGAGLADLRKQLHESQKALARSQTFLSHAATSWKKPLD